MAPILGGWNCGAPGPTASSFSCNSNPDLTAIPPGLFDFTPAIFTLYGRLDPPWAVAARSHRRLGRPPPYSTTVSLFPPACFDRPVSARCRDVNRALSWSPACDLYYPLVATPPPPWRGFGIRRGVYCRHLENNVITAIPTGLFNFTTALYTLYGRPRSAMGRGRPLAQATRSPATILGNRIALRSCVL